MGMLDIALSLVVAFFNLTGRTKTFVFIGLVALFTILWASAFGIRVAGTYYASEYQYSLDKELNTKCARDHDMRRLAYDVCKRAASVTRHSLFHNAWWGTWNASYVCGSSPCIDVVFGNDSTFVGVLIRVMIVALSVTATLIGVVYLRSLVYFGDATYKDRATQRYSREYKKHPREQQFWAIADTPYSNSHAPSEHTAASFWSVDKTSANHPKKQ